MSKKVKIKNKQEQEEDQLKHLLVKYYSHQLTIHQDKIALNQVKIKTGEDELENVEIIVFQYYKQVLNKISKLGYRELLFTCTLIENTDSEFKLSALQNCCKKFGIKA